MQLRQPARWRDSAHDRGHLGLVASGPPAGAASGPAPQRRVLLLADGQGLAAEGLAHVCARRREPLCVESVTTEEQALRRLTDPAADCVLLLLELRAPLAHGGPAGATLERLQPHLAGRPLALWADTEDPQCALELVRRGVQAVIPRTHDAARLCGALDALLGGGVYLPAELFRAAHPAAEGLADPPAAPSSGTTARELGLTQRQAQVLQLVLEGRSNKLIGRALSLSEGTVKTHVSAVLRALNVTSRVAAVLAARHLRLSLEP